MDAPRSTMLGLTVSAVLIVQFYRTREPLGSVVQRDMPSMQLSTRAGNNVGALILEVSAWGYWRRRSRNAPS